MAPSSTRKYMSYEDWRDLAADSQPPQGEDFYDGTGSEQPRTPNLAHVKLGGSNNVLGNPNHSSRNDEFTNAHSQWSHIAKTLDEGGDKALTLVRTAAKVGDEMVKLSEQKHQDGDAWIAIAGDRETARVLRGFITTTLDHFPPGDKVKAQNLPSTKEDAKFSEILKDMKQHRPDHFRPRVVEDGHIRHTDEGFQGSRRGEHFATFHGTEQQPEGKQKDYDGAVALFADKGQEKRAARYAIESPGNFAILPEKNPQLWRELGNERQTGMQFPTAYNTNSNPRVAASELANQADGGVFFWNGDHKSNTFAAVAEFSRQGKPMRIHGPDGRILPTLETMREAEAAHMSKKEYAQGLSRHAFDLDAGEPAAHFGLSLIRDDKLGTLGNKDINRLSQTGETINDISEMAKTPQGREYLNKEQKVSGGAIKLLGNEDVMSRARQSFIEISKEMKQEGVDIIGPMDYPENLIRSGNVPPYLFAQGDKDFFRNAGTIIGISGSPARDEHTRRMVSGSAAKAVASLGKQDVTTAFVQRQTPVDMPVTGPQIMIATSGNAHTPDSDRKKERDVIENGGIVLRTLPPKNASYYYDARAWNPERGRQGRMIGVPSTGNRHTENRSAGLLAAMSDTVVITDIDRHTPETPQHSALKQGLSSGRLPAVVNHSGLDGINHISGNRALLNNRGEKALAQAGLGERDASRLGAALQDRKPAMDTGRNPEKAMENLVRHVNGEALDLPQKTTRRRRQEAAEM